MEIVEGDKYCGYLLRSHVESPFRECMESNEEFRNKDDEEFEDCKADICGDFGSNNQELFNKIRCEALGGMLEDCEQENFSIDWRAKHGCGKYQVTASSVCTRKQKVFTLVSSDLCHCILTCHVFYNLKILIIHWFPPEWAKSFLKLPSVFLIKIMI